MPVIVIGADHPVGTAVVEVLVGRAGEVRAFVTDPQEAERLRSLGVKVAVGDVSDETHIGAAALGAFAAVLVTPAADDGRDLAFARPVAVPGLWVRAVADAGITRLIVVGDDEVAVPGTMAEHAFVATSDRRFDAIAAEVAALEDAERL